jgi:hypothetical protein
MGSIAQGSARKLLKQGRFIRVVGAEEAKQAMTTIISRLDLRRAATKKP